MIWYSWKVSENPDPKIVINPDKSGIAMKIWD